MSSLWRHSILLCLVLLAMSSCASDEKVPQADSQAVSEPAGQRAKLLDNPLHARHLAGTTPLLCGDCHDIEATAFTAPKVERCLACHTEEATRLHGDGVECRACHVFAAGRVAAKSDCQRCHAEAQEGKPAIVAHALVDCRNCHAPHSEPKLAVKDCLECHEDHQQNHGGKGLSTVERCSQCHVPHSKSLEAVTRCQGCHKDKLVRAVFRGHDKCDTCHQGDTRSAPSKPLPCTGCHSDRLTLASQSAEPHKACTSCHAPHDPRGTAIQSCRRCHQDVAPKHPGLKASGSCLGCHPAHPKAPASIAVACSSCHRQASGDDMLHAPKKTKCVQCHQPHQFQPPACASCHEREATLTRLASGHDQCSACHQTPHAPKATPGTCASCHVAEYQSANLGHKDCRACHQPHSGERLPAARCATCHKEKLQMTHGRIDGGCENCHRPHGPQGKARPPACLSCHKQKQLPSLHAVEAHNQCTTCHRGHGMGDLGRATCLGNCHVDRVQHEAVAKTCVGCHPFGASR